ncbi:hypothetical protein ACFL27_06580 [candidate division CSSED10-310 bacterium]|uniref:Uncharacterized protein n=1 Tax=candidate division CSSED10-310 bacterium TaxID=2855610 RepID=A0ABV6YUJ6_UNCC1
MYKLLYLVFIGAFTGDALPSDEEILSRDTKTSTRVLVVVYSYTGNTNEQGNTQMGAGTVK